MRAFQPGLFQLDFVQDQVDAEIVQTLPSLSQSATATATAPAPVEEMGDVLGRMFQFRAPSLEVMRVARIRQTLPSLEQSATANVTDDELVLLLV